MKKNKKHSSLGHEITKSAFMDIDFDSLRKRLVEEDKFISNIIDTIPPKLYFDQEIQEKITAQKHLAMDQAATDFKRGAHGKEMSSKNKHKRARLDPLRHKSVSEIQKEEAPRQKHLKKKNLAVLSASLTRAANIEELQQRLQKRIKELRAKRASNTEAESLERKRLISKVKKIKQKKGNLNKTILKATSTAAQPSKPKVEKTDLKPKPIYNKEGKIIYSKFDFTETGEKVKDKKKKKMLVGKNYKNLLNQVEREQEKLESIKEKDREKANTLIQKKAWERAIQKAEGAKLKDDPTLLKKSLKRKEKQKMKSEKEWQKRKEQTEYRMKQRQDKRKKNIQNRKKEKVEKKVKKAKKKGRIIPGF